MKRSMAMRILAMLRERGLSGSIGVQSLAIDNCYTVTWWVDDMGEQFTITGKSLVCDQHWMDLPIKKELEV